jgi:hypothetical protein
MAKKPPDYAALARILEADWKRQWLAIYGQPQRANETYRTNSDGTSWLGGVAESEKEKG